MKAGKEHRVPLSGGAIVILNGMQNIRRGDFVFPSSKRSKPLSNMAMLSLVRRMGNGGNVTVHGFRSTFRDWISERTNFSSEVAEMALAHSTSNKVEAAYRRGDVFDKRRRLMDAWRDYCAGKSVDSEVVVPIRKQV